MKCITISNNKKKNHHNKYTICVLRGNKSCIHIKMNFESKILFLSFNIINYIIMIKIIFNKIIIVVFHTSYNKIHNIIIQKKNKERHIENITEMKNAQKCTQSPFYEHSTISSFMHKL